MNVQTLLLLLAAALSAGDGPRPRIEVWSVVIGTRLRGAPHVDRFEAAEWDAGNVRTCASPAQIRAAAEATIPPQVAELRGMDTLVARDLVVTLLDRRGRALCSYVVPATIDTAIEAPPSPDGKVGFSWSVVRNDPTSALVGIPRRCNVAAMRISGWRGVESTTYSIAELARRLDPNGEPCR
jgi:hypothetical protein